MLEPLDGTQLTARPVPQALTVRRAGKIREPVKAIGLPKTLCLLEVGLRMETAPVGMIGNALAVRIRRQLRLDLQRHIDKPPKVAAGLFPNRIELILRVKQRFREDSRRRREGMCQYNRPQSQRSAFPRYFFKIQWHNVYNSTRLHSIQPPPDFRGGGFALTRDRHV